MPKETRRALLEPVRNPKQDSEYIIQLRHKLAPRGIDAARGVMLHLHYIPDALMLTADAFHSYLSYFETQAEEYTSLEALGADIVEDINNELVPKWIHLIVGAEHAHTIHRVHYEERHPGWDNGFLLSRLSRIGD